MPIEVELKAHLANPDATINLLRERATAETSSYQDTYYDWPDRCLEQAGRQELRLRIVETAGNTRCVSTFKGVMLDAASTPEYETVVDDADAAHTILTALGLEPVIAYTKQCQNFRFTVDTRDIIATVVRIPEIDGVFLEVGTLVHEADGVNEAQATIHNVLGSLELGSSDLEPTFYIDLVRQRRARIS